MKTNIKLRVTPEQSKAVQKICFNNKIYWALTGSNFEEDNVRYIFIYIDVMTLTDESTFFHKHKLEEIDADLFIRTNGTCVEPEETTIEATIEECQFAKYGFEKPDFECVILTKIKDEFIGYIIKQDIRKQDIVIATTWSEDGIAYLGSKRDRKYDLPPIKRPWYETCKFPILVWDDDNDLFAIRTRGEYTALYLNACIPLTNDEIEGLKQ